ncbi:MAG: hypothetical protein ACLQJ7_16460, partial [Syntrophobacteraceae bacterium]
VGLCGYSRSFFRRNPIPKCGSASIDSQVDALFRIIAFYVKLGEKILGAVSGRVEFFSWRISAELSHTFFAGG